MKEPDSNRNVQLPAEVWETVFANLPVYDIFRSISSVCKQWRDIAQRELFLLQKKTYHKFKCMKCSEVTSQIKMTAHGNGMDSLENCFTGLIRYMNKWGGNITAGGEAIRKHPKYPMAIALISERFPDLILKETGSTRNPWSLVAAICVLAEDVWDIYGIFRALTSPMNSYTGKSVIEALYCIATLLLYFEREYQAPHRYHYVVYYGIYLYENSWHSIETPALLASSGADNGQKSIRSYFPEDKRSFNFTHEQKRIINHQLLPNQVVRIIAFAGTGKTSTLVRFAQDRPHLSFLVVLYNKAAQLTSEKLFPQNCVVKTAHALAFSDVGWRYQHKHAFNIKAQDIERSNIIPRSGRGYYATRCAIVGKTIEGFMNSSDPFITLRHVPEKWQEKAKVKDLDDDERLSISEDAVMVWEEMVNTQSQKMKMTFDGYFKVWQLTHPTLTDRKTKSAYDCILIDEGQDMNPAMLDVLMRQVCSKIIVGDPYQQIYIFRGAVNALDLVPATHTYYLTQSFRFGPEIAFLANSCLSALRDVKTRTLIGGAKEDDVTGAKDFGDSLTIIGRSNIGVYKEAIRLLIDQPAASANARKRVAFSGGFESYNYVLILDLWYLKNMELEKMSPKGKWMARWGGYDSLKNYADKTLDSELLGKIGMVEYTGPRTEIVVKTLQQRCKSEDVKNADIVFSTAHKAKGLEWDRVHVLDDFTSAIPLLREAFGSALMDRLPGLAHSMSAIAPNEDEFNLLYVATTRAKKQLILSPVLFFVLQEASDRMERPVLLSSAPDTAKCGYCLKPLNAPEDTTPKSIILKTPCIRLSSRKLQQSRYVCSRCVFLGEYVLPLSLVRSTMTLDNVISEDRNHICLRSLLGPISKEEREKASAFTEDLANYAWELIHFYNFATEGPPTPAQQLAVAVPAVPKQAVAPGGGAAVAAGVVAGPHPSASASVAVDGGADQGARESVRRNLQNSVNDDEPVKKSPKRQ